jgi:hypothetical protein
MSEAATRDHSVRAEQRSDLIVQLSPVTVTTHTAIS